MNLKLNLILMPLLLSSIADGYVIIEYQMDVDPTRARVQVITRGEPYGIIIKDQDGLPLDFSLINNTLTIDTLGATSITISYRISEGSNETEFVPMNQTVQDTPERYIIGNNTGDTIELNEINSYIPAYVLCVLFIILGLLLVRRSRRSQRHHEWRIEESEWKQRGRRCN